MSTVWTLGHLEDAVRCSAKCGGEQQGPEVIDRAELRSRDGEAV